MIAVRTEASALSLFHCPHQCHHMNLFLVMLIIRSCIIFHKLGFLFSQNYEFFSQALYSYSLRTIDFMIADAIQAWLQD